jgi:DNA mismatch repair protein MutS
MAIARAVAESLVEVGCKTLFATHYHQLNDLADQMSGVCNFRVAVKEQGDHVIWLHKVLPGGTDRSYGIQVARMAGVPRSVVERATEILLELEQRAPLEPLHIEKRKKLQLTLFEAEQSPILEELKKLNLSEMTPVEALMKLDEWRRKQQGQK